MGTNRKGQITKDLKVTKMGRGRVLSITQFVPEGYGWVRVTRTRFNDNEVWLHIRKLTLNEAD